MKNDIVEEQKINLIDCEKIPLTDNLQNSTSQIKYNAPVSVKFIDEKPQAVNIYHTETVIDIKQAK